MSDGNFFEKRAKATGGRFYRDLRGRDSGNFHKEAQSSYAPGAAMSGQMGGSFGVGSSATGGGMYGTGDGKKKDKKDADKETQVSKNGATVDGEEKKAEVREEHEGHGWHRPTEEQPTALEASGSRFLQESHGATAVNEPATSGLNKSKQMKKSASMRFMGTGFEKKAESDIISAGRDTLRRAGPGARETGARTLESAQRFGGKVIRGTGDIVSKGTKTISESEPLSAAMVALGGLAALRSGKGLAKAVSRLGRRKKSVPAGVLAKLRRRISGK